MSIKYRFSLTAPGVSLFILVLLFLSGCASLPKGIERSPSFVISDTSETSLAKDIAPLLEKNPEKSGFYLLSEGIEALAARLVIMRDAEKSIDLQYYIWHHDLTGKAMHHMLLEAADRGVRVRLLLDDLDTAGKDDILRMIDAHPNIEIRLYNPFPNRGFRTADFIGDTSRVNRRSHNKTITIDNQTTIFGGRNIGDEYFDAAEEVGFSDLDILAIGPVANEISRSFDLYWNSEWVYPLSVFFDNEAPGDADYASYRRDLDQFIEQANKTEYGVAIEALKLHEVTSFEDIDFEWGKWVLAYDHPGKVTAKEVTRETHLAPKLKEGMDATKNELLIVSPYFVPGESFTQYLVGLVEKGISVRIMTNSLAANDVSMVHAGYRRYRKDLVRGGVDLYEFKPIFNKASADQSKEGKKSSWTGSSRASLHGKYFGFDQQYVFVGSFNLDGRSVALNTEIGVYFESEKYGRMLSESFNKRAMVKGYRVSLDEDGDLQWVTLNDESALVTYDVEPETGFWQRFFNRFLSLIVPESQL